MAKKGVRKIDEIVWEDGTKYPIRLDMKSSTFSVSIPDPESPYRSLARFSGGNVEQVREEAEEWLRDNARLPWEPVIVLKRREKGPGGARYFSESSVDLEYSRLYRAGRRDGSHLWKEFAKAGDKHLNEAGKDDTEGQPGRPAHAPFLDARVVMPYTPAHWSALRMISAMVRQLNERIDALIEQGRFSDALDSIALRGAAALLPAPKGD